MVMSVNCLPNSKSGKKIAPPALTIFGLAAIPGIVEQFFLFRNGNQIFGEGRIVEGVHEFIDPSLWTIPFCMRSIQQIYQASNNYYLHNQNSLNVL